jgi:hypothetical protein
VSLECIWCQEWKPGIEKINGPITLQQIRNPAYKPSFVPFKFCPWCGHELHEIASSPVNQSGDA